MIRAAPFTYHIQGCIMLMLVRPSGNYVDHYRARPPKVRTSHFSLLETTRHPKLPHTLLHPSHHREDLATEILCSFPVLINPHSRFHIHQARKYPDLRCAARELRPEALRNALSVSQMTMVTRHLIALGLYHLAMRICQRHQERQRLLAKLTVLRTVFAPMVRQRAWNLCSPLGRLYQELKSDGVGHSAHMPLSAR